MTKLKLKFMLIVLGYIVQTMPVDSELSKDAFRLMNDVKDKMKEE